MLTHIRILRRQDMGGAFSYEWRVKVYLIMLGVRTISILAHLAARLQPACTPTNRLPRGKSRSQVQ